MRFTVFKDTVTTEAIEMVGYRALRSQRKGSAWWTDEIKMAIKRKRRVVYKKMLPRNVEKGIRVRRRIE